MGCVDFRDGARKSGGFGCPGAAWAVGMALRMEISLMATRARRQGDSVSWCEFRALLGPPRSLALKASLAAVFAAALPACYLLYRHGWFLSFNEWIKTQGVAGVFAFAIVDVVIAVFLLAPSELMWVAAGVVFDAWGTPLVVVSSVVASLVAFLLSRHVLRPKIKASPRKSPAAARNRCGHWIPELASRHPAAAKRASAFQFPELLPRGNGHRACALCYNYPFRHYAFCDNVRLSRECRTNHCD